MTIVPGVAGHAPSPVDRMRLLEARSYLSFLSTELGAGVRKGVLRGEVAGEILAARGAQAGAGSATGSPGRW